MLIINRLRIEVFTENGLYGIDETFNTGLNIIKSSDNTKGKSSVLAGIYYCLGLEQIIGGIGKKILPSVYRQVLKDDMNKYKVLQSNVFLEINNGIDTITISRPVITNGKDDKLITIYESTLKDIGNNTVKRFDTYVHMPNSTTNYKGYHRFLNDFLKLDIPEVQSTDGSYRKLYIQLIFSAFFIEQKNGWSGILSGIPYLGIRDAKSKVIEYVLDLDIIENQKKRERVKQQKVEIEEEWKQNIQELRILADSLNIDIIDLFENPKILNETDYNKITLMFEGEHIESVIENTKLELIKINNKDFNNAENFDELNEELEEIENSINKNIKIRSQLADRKTQQEYALESIENSIEIIDNDIINNKDSKRLINMGSDIQSSVLNSLCPLCNNEIKDTLLPIEDGLQIMSIDDNILHLQAQRELLVVSRESHISNILNIEKELKRISAENYKLRQLAKYINSDLKSSENSLSQSEILKKITYEDKLNKLEKFINRVSDSKKIFEKLSLRWQEYLSEKSELPEKYLSENDVKKINLLERKFIKNLRKFSYESINTESIKISKDNYMPLTKGFDMKFDSSASDNVRTIWSYTLALLEVSLLKHGNHCNLIIFDEPGQHSMIPKDTSALLDSLINISQDSKLSSTQSIVALTQKDENTIDIINKLDEDSYNEISIQDRAFSKIEEL